MNLPLLKDLTTSNIITFKTNANISFEFFFGNLFSILNKEQTLKTFCKRKN